MNENPLTYYDGHVDLYRELATKLQSLVTDLLRTEIMAVHSVSSRVKTRSSLAKKLERVGGSYRSLDDVTDVIGIRIICHFADDVDAVGKLIEREFDVDRINTTDKRELLDPDRFGYLSVHHIVSLAPNRAELAEYRRFPKVPMEIQTRSILQHAWAEIEHDIGYKATYEVPRHLRRRFSRVAGLLELADEEFRQIRDDLARYEQSVRNGIDEDPQSVLLDLVSLTAFVEQERLVQRIDERISNVTGRSPVELTNRYLDMTLKRLQLAGLTNLAQVRKNLASRDEVVVRFAERFVGQKQNRTVTFPRGISLFFLAYVIVAESESDEVIASFISAAELTISVGHLRETYRASQRASKRPQATRRGRRLAPQRRKK
jgi:putative GTP pyrophosphokinase